MKFNQEHYFGNYCRETASNVVVLTQIQKKRLAVWMYVTDIKDYTGFNVKGLVLAPADVLNNTKKQLEETWYIFHLFRSSERNI